MLMPMPNCRANAPLGAEVWRNVSCWQVSLLKGLRGFAQKVPVLAVSP